jgi:hypothetical protein
MANLPPWVFTFVTAELLFLLVRSQDFKNIVKKDQQRTARERHRLSRGLVRAIMLDMLVFVPASCTLLLLLSTLIVFRQEEPMHVRASYATLGLVSYGFPFAALRAIVTRIALNTLKEFATVAAPTAREDDGV